MAVALPTYPDFRVTDDPSVAHRWEEWLDEFEAMIRAMKVTDKEDKKAMLVHYAGGNVHKLLKTLPTPESADREEVYKTAITTLTDYFAPKMNSVYLMNSLQQVRQNPGETVDAFYMRVQEKAEPIKLADMSKEQIADLIILAQLVNHCTNNSLRKKALKDGLTLTDFLSHARAFERAEHQANEIVGAAEATVNRVQDQQPKPQNSAEDNRNRARWGRARAKNSAEDMLQVWWRLPPHRAMSSHICRL